MSASSAAKKLVDLGRISTRRSVAVLLNGREFSKFNDRLARPHRRDKRVWRLGDGRHRDEHVCNSPSVIYSKTHFCSFSSSKDQQTELLPTVPMDELGIKHGTLKLQLNSNLFLSVCFLLKRKRNSK